MGGVSDVSDPVEALVAAMTRPEKLAQLQVTFAMQAADRASLARRGIGALFWPMSAAETNAAQGEAVENSAHGIPLLIGLDVIHGQRTIFPIPLAQACSFDPDVAREDGRVSALEASSGGVNWTFAPMLDVSRDPRWGRVCEGFGEDVLLTGDFAVAKVAGLQGNSLSGFGSIAACAKHFVGYGAAESGRDYNTVDVSERRLREVYLPPFQRALAAGCASVMASFNTVAGRPVHANAWLLSDVLKDEWGFGGPVVGDADGVRNLLAHGVAADLADARRQAFAAGLDIEMGMGTDLDELAAHLDLDGERLDDAVRRVLRLKVALGLFEDPYVDESAEILDAPASHRSVARRAAERCAVLLRNDGTLPLRTGSADHPLRVLLTGPYANSTDHLGAWVQHFAQPATNLADALRTGHDGIEITVSPGATLLGNDPHLQLDAAAAATEHHVVVVAVGEPSDLSGEASSLADLRLTGDQEALIHAIADSGVPFVVVLVTGRPLVVADWVDRAPSVLLTWHLGTEAAPAIANLLTGRACPGGRLAMSFPRAVGQLPAHYDHENTGRPASVGGRLEPKAFDVGLDGPANLQEFYTSKYRDLELGPQFAFGHGLSYARFEHNAVQVSPSTVRHADLVAGEQVTVSCRVRNAGDRDADEVVMVFVRDVVASLAQPVRRLVAYERVPVPAGETRTVRLAFGWERLAFWSPDGAGDRHGSRVEPGTFEVHVGPTLDGRTALQLVVTGD